MNTSLNIKSVEQSSGRKLQKTITDVNPNADGTALKTWAQGLNNLTTNSYVGTTKINIDNLLEEDTGGGGSGAVNPLPVPTVVAIYLTQTGVEDADQVQTLEFTNASASLTINPLRWNSILLAIDSTSNLNVTGTPANAAATLAKTNDYERTNVGPLPATKPAVIANMQNPTFWLVCFSQPDWESADCLGNFTFTLNATETHSSATITVNIAARADF